MKVGDLQSWLVKDSLRTTDGFLKSHYWNYISSLRVNQEKGFHQEILKVSRHKTLSWELSEGPQAAYFQQRIKSAHTKFAWQRT